MWTVLTENQLQRQIILLQQTVIGVLEDALYSGRQLNRAGVEKLVNASKLARNGSLDALKGQHQRILQQLPPPRPPSLEVETKVVEVGSRGSSPHQRLQRLPPPRPLPPREVEPKVVELVSRRSSPHQRLIEALPPPPRRKSGMEFFCRYSIDLQRSPLPLARAFDPGRGSKCPSCKITIPVDAAEFWDVELPVKQKQILGTMIAKDPKTPGTSPARERSADSRDRGRSKTVKEVVAVVEQKPREHKLRFQVRARFVVKCHTREGDYACVLCCGPVGDYSGVVVLCDDPDSLIDHVVKEHGIADIERDVDILPS